MAALGKRVSTLGWQLMGNRALLLGGGFAVLPTHTRCLGSRGQGLVAKEQHVALVSATGEDLVPGRDDSPRVLLLLLQNCNE